MIHPIKSHKSTWSCHGGPVLSRLVWICHHQGLPAAFEGVDRTIETWDAFGMNMLNIYIYINTHNTTFSQAVQTNLVKLKS